MEVVLGLWIFLLGLVLGSFFNVVIYRLPRKLSLVKPGSSCPQCGHRLGPGELVPVLSYIWQMGKCRKCGEGISLRYPIVELTTGLGFLALWQSRSSFTEFLVGVVFFSLLLILALIDLDHKLLPNVLTIPGTALGLLFGLLGWTGSFWTSLLGAGVGFLLIFLIALISRGGMGMGDAKLMAMIGAFLGWKSVFYVLFGASFLGSIGGILYLYLTKQDRKTPIPFGPSLAAAALIVYFLKLT
jgi:prepilin signal peptidase PulO-like enzyme (type II secretory pathway)